MCYVPSWRREGEGAGEGGGGKLGGRQLGGGRVNRNGKYTRI